jgi:uncharacterized protein (TIGR01777 family)
MKVLITGATGLVGNEIVQHFLQSGDVVHYLTTSKTKLKSLENCKGFLWDPQQGILDENALIGVDVIIHLAGASIAKRWTNTYKEEILESRILSTNCLYKALKHNPHQVKQIVAASAIGIYPSSESIEYSEEMNEYEDTFLGNVVHKWEEVVDSFSLLNIKVCKLRIGMVLSNDGGVMKIMMKPISSGVGTVLGSGNQWQSWIHIHDLARIFYFAVHHKLEGIYNAVAPNPVTHKEFTLTLAQKLHKKIVLPRVPIFILQLLLGEMHQLVIDSQKVASQKIENTGFVFKYRELEKAFSNLLT